MEKLKQVISYILDKSQEGKNRLDLSKLIYYSDTVFFQRHKSIITGQRYIHLEDCPQPFQFAEAIASLIEKSQIEAKPTIQNGKMVGFLLHSLNPIYSSLQKEELRIINKVLRAFPVHVVDENRQYPNLYESYVVTPIYGEILINTGRINTKIHFHKKKSLLSLSGKIFRVLFEE